MIDWSSIALMVLALGAGALVKGATGIGLPVVAVPALAAFFGVPHTIAIMLLPILSTNAWQAWLHRDQAKVIPFMPIMITACVIGIVIGTWVLVTVSERHLSATLGIMVLIYIAMQLVRPDVRLAPALAKRLAPAAGFLAGALQAATGISAPISITFFHALKLSREAYIFGVSALFCSMSLTQLPSLTVAGVLTPTILLESALALIPVLAVMPVGMWLGRHVGPRLFDRIVLVMLAVIAVKLLIDGFG